MQFTLHQILCGVAAALFLGVPATQATVQMQSDDVVIDSPALHALYEKYPAYHEVFDTYALKQGFKRPYERIGTVLHELIHIDSMVHQGFFIEGVYYEPYLDAGAWPTLTNKDIDALLPNEEKDHRIFWQYVRNTPSNTLANALDELNAYSHVTAWMCRHDETGAVKQLANIKGFLWLVQRFLDMTHEHTPAESRALALNPVSSSALHLIVTRAKQVLAQCALASYLNVTESE
ncbi:MAG: hypothetical protein AB7C98_05895 [Acidithiobacillus sp.]